MIALVLVVTGAGARSALRDCTAIFDDGREWLIDACPSDPSVDSLMTVALDGQPLAAAALVRISHATEDRARTPQVVVVYSSGYVRLKQNADPTPAIPFGASFVLGPAYWSGPDAYHHNPTLDRIEIDTSWLPSGPLRMHAVGTNRDFDVAYEMTLPPPRDRQTRLHVSQVFSATASVVVDAARLSEHQGFKLVQGSSMYINEGSACDGGHRDCHDSDGVRYVADDLVRHEAAFRDVAPQGLLFDAPAPLGSTWLDVLHTDDDSWHGGAETSGNTPNARIVLDTLPSENSITPQGHVTATTDPTDDNVGVWLHDDSAAARTWHEGGTGEIGYWLLAQDDPPDPWYDLGLRRGSTVLDFGSTNNCYVVLPGPPVTASLDLVPGYGDTSLQLTYELGPGDGSWAQIRCDFEPPLDLSAHDHLRFEWRGDPAAGNSLEVGLVNPGGPGDAIFARGYHHVTHRGWWGQLVVPFNFLHPWTDGTSFDPGQVSALLIAVVKDQVDDVGGTGRLAIDNVGAYDVSTRTVPERGSDTKAISLPAARAAADWLVAQQRPNGFVKSWAEEDQCLAHTYDQALALLVLLRERRRSAADALVDALVTSQNADGSWFQTRDCATVQPTTDNKWEGDIAWAVFALGRYVDTGGKHPGARTAMLRGANWIAGRINASDGCLEIDHTEGTIDAWWAMRAAGPGFASQANQLERCLIEHYWDEEDGRFKGGRSWQQPYLDNQTWGGAFLTAVGRDEDARRAMAYARDVLVLPARGGQVFGFDGQGGPWSVWNEGAGQYVAGDVSDGADLLLELLAQQRDDGAMPGSPDDFAGGGVWTTHWHGVAPTAWLYFALCGGPFGNAEGSGCFATHLPVTSTVY